MSLTGLGFLGLYFSGLLMSLARHPVWGLYVYLLAFYGYPPGRWWGEGLPSLRWALIAAIVTFVASLKLKPPEWRPGWNRNAAAVILIIYTLWLWMQTPWALSQSEHLGLAILFTKYIILFVLMYRIIDSEEILYRFALAHVVGCAYYGYLAYSVASGGRFENIGGPGVDDANAFATHMATGVLFGSMLLFRAKKWERLVIVLSMPFILNAIILTQSRGAFLGLVMGGASLIYLKPPAFKKPFWALAGLALVLFGYLAHGFFWERVMSVTEAVDVEQRDNSAESRVQLLQAQWKMFKLSPLMGHGHRGTAALSPIFLEQKYLSSLAGQVGKRSSHNTLMSTLVEQGILGAVLYVALAWWLFRRLRWLRSLDALGLSPELAIYRAAAGASLVAIFVAGQFADYLKAEVQVWCFVMIVIVSNLAARDVGVPVPGQPKPLPGAPRTGARVGPAPSPGPT